jgi:hypothetical protein
VLVAFALFVMQDMQVLPDIDSAEAYRPMQSILQHVADIPGVDAAVEATRRIGGSADELAQAKSRYVIEYAALFVGYAVTAFTVLVLVLLRRDWNGLFRDAQRPGVTKTVIAMAVLVAISMGFGAIGVLNPSHAGVFRHLDYACLGLPISCALALLSIEYAVARSRFGAGR